MDNLRLNKMIKYEQCLIIWDRAVWKVTKGKKMNDEAC